MLRVAESTNLEVELPRAQTAGRVARGALRRWCGDRVDEEVLVDAELLVSELATNALVHGDGQITLRARLDQDRLLVELIDEGSGFERALRRGDFRQIGGWGLGIVDDVASRWGVHEGTTHVWFELERAGPRLAEADC
ncbi:MAG TPA: ATP-binding protein [Solirubrobacteraceae bacterium]|nr:ATP-binding protein [Solirubrobacteraceae bacterium]